MPDKALVEFKESLSRVRTLLALDRRWHSDPPSATDRPAAEGLRASAAVLMVAAFEGFSRTLLEETMARVSQCVLGKPEYERLPAKVQVASVYAGLKLKMDGPKGSRTERIDRLGDIRAAAALAVAHKLIPEAFGSTEGNPGPGVISRMCGDAGLTDIFVTAKPRFEKRWGGPVAANYIQDTLQTIVNRRHQVAHGSALSLFSRQDLTDAVKFLRVLGEVLDAELRLHARALIKLTRGP